jgi:hypothetical protein
MKESGIIKYILPIRIFIQIFSAMGIVSGIWVFSAGDLFGRIIKHVENNDLFFINSSF